MTTAAAAAESKPTTEMEGEQSSLGRIKQVILVLSGKGGVGKSSISAQLAVCLAYQGYKVGLMDVDLCGPSIPRMFNIVDARIKQGLNGWIPITVNDGPELQIKIMSLGFLLPSKDDAVVWRAMIRQFIFNVEWGELDYLLIDTPPGTSDEHISIVECLANHHPHAILVTTPQLVAIADVEREIGFCQQLAIPILGVIENMSGYVCPHCTHCSNLFSSEGGRQLAQKHQLPFLGRIPISPSLTRLLESDSSNLLRDYSTIQDLYAILCQISSCITALK